MSESPVSRSPNRFPPNLAFIPWLVGVIFVLIWAWATGWPVYTLKTDIDQGRLNVTLPPPDGTVVIRQSFTPTRDGLQEMELLLARYDEPHEGDRGRVTLQLLDEAGNRVAEQEWPTAAIKHNDSRRFQLPNLPAGQTYTLVIQGSEDNTVSVWGYDQDVLAGGELSLTGAESTAQELRFTIRYRLTFAEAVEILSQILWQRGPFLLLTLVFLFLPGLFLQQMAGWLMGRTAWKGRSTPESRTLVLSRAEETHHDLPTRLGIALALGVSFWAVLWLWSSWLGWHWRGWSLAVVLVGMGAVWLWRLAAGRDQLPVTSDQLPVTSGRSSFTVHHSPFTIHHWLLLFILLLGFAGRLLALRDQAFPPWVDSSRHALITAVMAEQGRFLSDYEPFLGVVRAPYHYGFHTISASLQLLTGWEVHTLLLWLGPVLNGLVPLAVYAAATLFSRRRSVATAAAFLVALPFFFPAYYATWGRFTQLTGMLVLPVLVGVSSFEFRVSGGRWQGAGGRWQVAKWVGGVLPIGLLAAGLFLIHFRVFLLYIPFVLVLLLFRLPPLLFRSRRLSTQHSVLSTQSSPLSPQHSVLSTLFAATLLSLLLILPRLVRLFQEHNLTAAFSNSPEGYNDFPVAYFTTGWETYFAYAALACLVVSLWAWFRGRLWARGPVVLGGWVGLLFALLRGRELGLPETWLINTNSMVITLFLPTAVVLALVGERVGRWLTRPHWVLQLAGYGMVGGWFAAATLFGLERQVNILNETTLLTRQADVAGIHWVDENLPADAVIAVNSWKWLGSTWAGADGGAWLTPLTGRLTTTPPVDYLYNRLLSLQVQAWNQEMMAITDWSGGSAAAYLRSQGITHLFVGQKGGFLDPSELLRNPDLTLLYVEDGVFVFGVR